MGTPAQATKFNELNGQVDLWMLSAIIALVSIGLVMVASSSMSFAVMTGSGPFHYFIRHLMFLAGGLVLVFFIMRTEIKKIEKYGYVLLGLCFMALLIFWLPGIGK